MKPEALQEKTLEISMNTQNRLEELLNPHGLSPEVIKNFLNIDDKTLDEKKDKIYELLRKLEFSAHRKNGNNEKTPEEEQIVAEIVKLTE